jgi:predicted dehydrogenase
MVAFNRRFDPNFARLEAEIRAGRIGRPEILRITSYDPAPCGGFCRRRSSSCAALAACSAT